MRGGGVCTCAWMCMLIYTRFVLGAAGGQECVPAPPLQALKNPPSQHTLDAPARQVKFALDFGPALGGRYTARPVGAFLDPFLRDTLANSIVWPQRCAHCLY